MPAVRAHLINDAARALEVEVGAPIGTKGGQKAVYLAKDAGGMQHVLKVIDLAGDGGANLKRAQREVDLLERMGHPNLVRIQSGLVHLGNPVEGVAWLEEHLVGTDLSDLLDDEMWEWADVKELGIQVADALGATHDESVIHRDLSAANVMQCSGGRYVVIDFGFAKFDLLSAVTVMGQPLTPGHASPEHLRAHSGGPTSMSDVFQVGILMYAALAGRSPFPYEGDMDAYIGCLLGNERPGLADLRPDLLPEQVGVVERALHPQPGRRFIDGHALAEALRSTP